jgi:shikimate dehydrogenase
MKYGLIGKTLKHSFSKDIHERLGYEYSLKELAPEELDTFFKKKDFSAINVTIPYKEAVIKYLNEIDPAVLQIGACNTIINKNGRLFGYNTDFSGARALILRQNIPIQGKKALILGTGGTSKTYYHVLKSLGAAKIKKVSRTPANEEISYDEAYSRCSDAEIIINTTPVGMFPNTDASPIDPSRFPQLSLVVDAIYNPLRTELVLKARQHSVKSSGGLYMLVSQAVFASELFEKVKADEKTITNIYHTLLKEKRNTVFIGMPGVGKSTIARLIGGNYIDTDKEIEKKYLMSPKDIILKYGEKKFREKESTVIKSLSDINGVAIATGGGVPLSEENIKNLKKNGIVIYLDAPLERLTATEGRPLSKNPELLKKLYTQRKDVYAAACDISVSAAGSIDDTLKNVKEALENYENTCY